MKSSGWPIFRGKLAVSYRECIMFSKKSTFSIAPMTMAAGETLQIQSHRWIPCWTRSPEKARGTQAVGFFSSGFGFLSFLCLNIFFSNEGSWFGCVTF